MLDRRVREVVKVAAIVLGKRFFQVVFSIVFSLGPFLVLSGGAFFDTDRSMGEEFLNNFRNDQLAFMSISLVGLVIWNSVFRYKSKYVVIAFVLIAIIMLFIATNVASQTSEATSYSGSALTGLWLMYGICLFLWFLALLGREDTEKEFVGSSTDRRVDNLLENVK